jgi:dTMP kinase
LVLIYTLSLIPQSAYAASGRIISEVPGRSIVSPIQVSMPVVRLGGLKTPETVSLPGINIGIPTLPGTPAVQAQAPSLSIDQAVAAGQIAVVNVGIPQPTAAAPQAAASNQTVETVVGRLTAAGDAASQVVQRPGGAESDSLRADFTEKTGPSADTQVPITGSLGTTGSLPHPSAQDPAKDDSAPSTPAPMKAPPPARGIWAYLSGVFAAQVANNALTVSLPLVLLHLGQTIGTIGFVTTLTTALDMSGTLVSGWLTQRFSPETVLKASTWARSAALMAIPLTLASGALTLPVAVALYVVDALARGVADTARNTMPMSLVGKEKSALDALNSKARTAFNVGGIVGPLLVGLLALKTFSNAGNWLVAGVFAAAAAAYHFMPRPTAATPASPTTETPAPATKASAFKRIIAERWLRTALITSVFLALSPALRALVPPAFADSLLHNPSLSAWLVLAFGLGGTAGSLAYNRLHNKLSSSSWIKLGALGAFAMAVGLLPGTFMALAAAIFLFAALNEMANLALTSSIQERIPAGSEGGIMGFLRFSSNGTSMLARFMMGLAFTAVAAPMAAFWLLAGGIAIVAAAQIFTSSRLRSLTAAATLAAGAAAAPKPSSIHGYPGRIIVVEGLDGSGKSTQMELLKEKLEGAGLKVVSTSWNSSDLISETVKKAKQDQTLTPKTFALLNAADFADRIDHVIKPALEEGSIVLADRWFYTALARDSVRGNDPKWLRGLYANALKPDITLYFKLPVETAIGRVLSRAQGRLGLSEDFDEAPHKRVLGQNLYAVGRDMHFAEDDHANFLQFQSKVISSYEAQSKEFGFRWVDASKSREIQHEGVFAQVLSALGPLSGFKRRPLRETRSNLFDKDPAGDADNIKRNYLHEKKGAHFYFRNMLLAMQDRFAQLMDLSDMPKVFLHGSPHVDNYAKTAEGAAMVDFDRSRVGPYAWDLVRLMVSISLRQKKEHGFLDPEVARQLRKGYLHGLRHPDRPFSEMRKLKDVEPSDDELTTDSYLHANKKWAKEMRANPLPNDDPDITALLKGYMVNRNEPDLLKDYFVEEAGRGQGSMGFRAMFLAVLAPRDPKSGKERLLLNMKQVRDDPDTYWYKNPYPTNGERMKRAADLHAPGWELRPGYAVLDGKEYYIRALPPLNAKLKKMLDQDEQRDLAYAAGTQLGRAHRLSLQEGASPDALEEHLKKHYDEILKAGETIREEILDAHERYLKNMKKRGLEPNGDAGDDE